MPLSLKTATRVKRQSQDTIYYHISDSTQIAKVPMRRLLSDAKTKKELTSFLVEKFLEHAEKTDMCVVVVLGGECQVTHANEDNSKARQFMKFSRHVYFCDFEVCILYF